MSPQEQQQEQIDQQGDGGYDYDDEEYEDTTAKNNSTETTTPSPSPSPSPTTTPPPPPAATSTSTTSTDNAAYLKKELLGRIQHEPELFDWLQKAALDGLWYWDLENIENEWLSPEFKELFGYTDDEVPNTSAWWQDNIFPEDKELAIESFQNHVTHGTPYNQIVRYRHKNGSTVWVRCRGIATFNNETGQPTRMLGAHSDVTQLMSIQEELKDKEQILDMLRTTSLDGYWDWNLQTGMKDISTRFYHKLGYTDTPEIELGCHYNTEESWKQLLVPEDVIKHQLALEQHIRTGETYSVVLRFIRKDKSIAHMLAQGVSQYDDTHQTGKKRIRMLGTYTDVSYLEQARAARQASEAKTIFLATMSHEIRTPLNAVLGMAEVLNNTELSEDQRECLNTLHNSGKHLLSLINNILDFSQIESGLLTVANVEFDIQKSIRDVVDALLVEAQNKGIGLTFETSIPAGTKFLGDNERTRQLVFNMVGNAIKFTEEGAVHVKLSPEIVDDCPGVRLEVEDSGVGMSDEQQDVIFDNFTQASSEIRRKFGGSGLGLSICKKLVTVLGGTIRVQSELGKGSTFSWWLPGYVKETAAAAPYPPSLSSPLVPDVGADEEREGGRGAGQRPPLPFLRKESSSLSSTTEDDVVLLFEDRDSTCCQETQGSVSSAIQAAGRTVQLFSDLSKLEETFQERSTSTTTSSSTSSPPTAVVSMVGKDPGDVYGFLKRNEKAQLIVVGKGLGRNVVEEYKDRLVRLHSFPTSDEFLNVFVPKHKKKKHRSHKSFHMSEIGRDLRVLLVEDNRINIRVMKRLLERFPCKVEVAVNGREAVTMASKKKWDIILMDLIMPELDGIDATLIIRETDKDTYIAALTANASTDDHDQCLEAGMNDFLTKPVSIDELKRVLTHAAMIVARDEETLGGGDKCQLSASSPLCVMDFVVD